ncbi:MAG: hypothetical protein Q4P34_03575 [Tissierellia bacterium]|nr:hypothetical protein [Tissierellia bacterium]
MTKLKILLISIIINFGLKLGYILGVKGCWGTTYREELDSEERDKLLQLIREDKLDD